MILIYLAIKAYSNKLKLEKAEKKDEKQLFISNPKHIIQIWISQSLLMDRQRLRL